MVTSVILVGQSAAQFNQAISPYVAFLFSCLLAVYQVVLVQKIKGRDSFIIAPIVAIILFALALGGNNSLGPATENAALKNELERVKEQLQFRTKELENAQQLSSRLRQIWDLPPNQSKPQEETSHQSNSGPDESSQTHNIPTLLDSLIRQAQAQPPDQTQPFDLETERRQRALEALRTYEARQQELQQKKQRLQEEQ
jgi:hypothetical protein